MFLIAESSRSASCIAFNCDVSSVFFHLEHFFSLSLIFLTLTLLRALEGSYSAECFSVWVGLSGSSWLYSGFAALAGIARWWCCILTVTCGFDLTHTDEVRWLKVVSVSFSSVELHFRLVLISDILGWGIGRMLRVCKYLVLHVFHLFICISM